MLLRGATRAAARAGRTTARGGQRRQRAPAAAATRTFISGLFGSKEERERYAVGQAAVRANAKEKLPFLEPLLAMTGLYSLEAGRLNCADAILRDCLQAGTREEMFKPSTKVQYEFRPKHALIVTHVWLAHRRLKHTGTESSSSSSFSEEDRRLQEAIFDQLWEDTQVRIRATGVPELTVTKHLTSMQKLSFAMCVEFDHALTFEDKDERLDHMSAALWRYVWQKAEGLTVEHCLELGRYVLAEHDRLAALPDDFFFQGRLGFGPLPKWSGLIPGTLVGTQNEDGTGGTVIGPEDASVVASVAAAEGEDENTSDWRATLSVTGRVYFWHVKTGETTYDKPEDFSGRMP